MTAFVNVNVVPMDTARVLVRQTVLMQKGSIIALGPVGQIKVPVGAVRIDGRGKYLIPGLADMHTHLPIDSLQRERALFRNLANGVTTIRIMDGDEKLIMNGTTATASLLQLRTRAALGTLLSPRIYTTGYLGCREATPETIASKVAAYQAAGYDFIKIRELCGGHLFDSLTAAARRLGIPYAGHAPDGFNLDQVLASGMRSIEHLMEYVETLLDVPPGKRYQPDTSSGNNALATQRQQLTAAWSRIPILAAATQRAGVWNCPTLAVDELFGHGSRANFASGRGSGYQETASRILKALQDAGAGLLLGTDVLVGGHGILVHRELELLVQAGLTPYQALAAGTKSPAAYFGTTAQSGTIAVGKRADLVLLDANPLADIRHTAAPAGVMLGGRWLPRTVLAVRTAAEQQELYRYAIMRALKSLPPMKTPEDQAFQQLHGGTHLAQFAALADSLGPGTLDQAAIQRAINLSVRHIGELRALLALAQQAAFDGSLDQWKRQLILEGYRVGS